MTSVAVSRPPSDAENLVCRSLVWYDPVGAPWERFLRASLRLLDGASSVILVEGFFGSGKTLFLKRFHLSWCYTERVTLTLLLPLRRLLREHLSVEYLRGGVVTAAALLTRRAVEEGRLCGDRELVELLRRAARVAEEEYRRVYSRGEYSVVEVLERLSRRLGLRVVLAIDELEYLTEDASGAAARQAPHAELYRVVLRDMLSIFRELYRMASGGYDSGVIIASVYKLSVLPLEAARVAAILLQEAGGEAARETTRLLSSLATLLVSYQARLSPTLLTMLEVLEERGTPSDETMLRLLWEEFELQMEPGDRLEPGLATRLGENLVELRYEPRDYRVLAEAVEVPEPRDEILETMWVNALPPRLVANFDPSPPRIAQRLREVKRVVEDALNAKRIRIAERYETQLRRTRYIQSLKRLLERIEEAKDPREALVYEPSMLRSITGGSLGYAALLTAMIIAQLPSGRATLGPPLYYPLFTTTGLNRSNPILPSLHTRELVKLAIWRTSTE